MNIKKLLFSLAICLFATNVWAEAFIVKSIEIQGLQRISRSTVLDYLPVKVGQRFDTEESSEVIRTLFNTGFFQDVSLAQSDNVLIVRVIERSTIGSIQVTGNKLIPKDKLNSVLKDMGLVEGGVFDRAVLDKVKNSLQSEYYNQGKYNATISSTVTPQPRNRVAVKIDISEGDIAKVYEIKLIGNRVFSSSTLLRQLDLTTPRLWSFFTKSDQYSKEKLDSSLEALRNYYLDRGYIKFKIDSTNVSLTPDKKKVYIVIRMTEGEQYTIKNYKLVGNLILPESQLRNLINIEPGSVFSKKTLTDAGQAIGKALGNLGYAFANINGQTDIDDVYKQVSIVFYVDPGVRVYVRRINFVGNTKTADVVLRREMRQMEGGLVNVDNIQESKRRLDLLGYLEKSEVTTKPVPGVDDQVDLDYHVTEGPSAQALAGVGYGTQGLVLNAGINQNNFLGTGKTVSLNFQHSTIATDYSFTYNNPYYTPEGIQRGFTAYMQRSTPGKLNLATYTTNAYGGSINYSIPVSEYSNIQLGYGLQHMQLNIGVTPSIQLLQFVATRGSRFNQLLLTGGWNRNALDKANFPTHGLNQQAGVVVSTPFTGASLDYYKLNYDAHWYIPMSKLFTLSLLGSAGFGSGYGHNSQLPFFVNYYAGGIGYSGAVRGFEPNSLGPKDSNGHALGGNLLGAGSVGVIFPNPFMERVRTTAFVDAGNVFDTFTHASSGPLRYSAGVSVDWRVPVFNVLLDVSLAAPINPRPGDQKEPFQFNIGTNF